MKKLFIGVPDEDDCREVDLSAVRSENLSVRVGSPLPLAQGGAMVEGIKYNMLDEIVYIFGTYDDGKIDQMLMGIPFSKVLHFEYPKYEADEV